MCHHTTTYGTPTVKSSDSSQSTTFSRSHSYVSVGCSSTGSCLSTHCDTSISTPIISSSVSPIYTQTPLYPPRVPGCRKTESRSTSAPTRRPSEPVLKVLHRPRLCSITCTPPLNNGTACTPALEPHYASDVPLVPDRSISNLSMQTCRLG